MHGAEGLEFRKAGFFYRNRQEHSDAISSQITYRPMVITVPGVIIGLAKVYLSGVEGGLCKLSIFRI